MDVRLAADESDVVGDGDVVRNALPHFFGIQVCSDHDHLGFSCGREDQLPDQRAFAGRKAEEYDVPAFQDDGAPLSQTGDLFLDGGGNETDQYAGDEQAAHCCQRQHDEIGQGAVLAGGHPGIDDGGEALPERGPEILFRIEVQACNDQRDHQDHQQGTDQEQTEQAHAAPGHAVVKPVLQSFFQSEFSFHSSSGSMT